MFFKYKGNIVSLRAAVENHFNNTMREISAGLPSVADDTMDDEDYNYYTDTDEEESAAEDEQAEAEQRGR